MEAIIFDILPSTEKSELKIATEGLSKGPVGGNHIIGSASVSIGELESEGQALTVEIAEALPVGSPVP